MNELKFHRKRCNTCKHYRTISVGSECKHPIGGRLLSVAGGGNYSDFARYCSEWTRKEKP